MSNFRYTRPDAFPPVIKNLVIINVLVWIAQNILDANYHLTQKLSLYPVMPEQLRRILVENKIYEDYEQFYPYQIATHMFSHAPLPAIYHILFNMFALWMFGRILENV